MPHTKLNYLNLTNGQLDGYIYRIMPERFVIDMFTSGQNVLSRISNWKDKFENFQLSLGGILDGQRFDYGFKDDFVGQCWSRDAWSEAMWGIYANDASQRYLRIRSTPRKLLESLTAFSPDAPQHRCFLGTVLYKKAAELEDYLRHESFEPSPTKFAEALLLKRHAFRHEREVRLLFFGEAKNHDAFGLYRYRVDPHSLITQIMADPNRDRGKWSADKLAIQRATGFKGPIKRSKIYDPPEWDLPSYRTV